MGNDKLTLEEKIDKILDYQKKMHRAQIIKSIINLIIFIVVVVLPIVWLMNWLKSMDLTGMMQTLNNIKDSTGGIEKLNEALKNLQY